jgi:hypothetical protein
MLRSWQKLRHVLLLHLRRIFAHEHFFCEAGETLSNISAFLVINIA